MLAAESSAGGNSRSRELMLFVLLAAMAIALFTTGQRLRRAEAKLENYQREYGILDVENPAMLQAAARWTPEPGQWRWRVYCPPGEYDLCCTTSKIPATGFPKDHDRSFNAPGEVNISAVIYKDPVSGRWKCQLANGGLRLFLDVPGSPLEAHMWETDGVLWNQPPAIVSPDQPLILLKERIGEKQKGGSYKCPDLSNGLMIWIRRAGGASGGHPSVHGR